MKALSIRQPWAWLIVHGHKDVENRSWSTRFRGPFLVHAGRELDKAGYAWVKEKFPHITLPEPSGLEIGGVVGMANLADCFGPEAVGDGAPSPWYMGQFGFVLAGARPLPFMPLKGKLGFFEADISFQATT